MSAIKWLLMVQKGTITPTLTPIVDDDGEQIQTGQSIIYGNSPSLLTRTRDANTFLGS